VLKVELFVSLFYQLSFIFLFPLQKGREEKSKAVSCGHF